MADDGPANRFCDSHGRFWPGLPAAKAGLWAADGCVSFEAVFVFLGTVFQFEFHYRISVASPVRKRIFKSFCQNPLVAVGFNMRHFVFRWIATTVAVMVAAQILSGIRYDTTGSLIAAALLLGILNAFVRPFLLILSAPLILVTLGFFVLVVNGFMLMVVPKLVSGFHVDSFGSAFWGALIISIISWMLSAFFRGSDGRVHVLTHHSQIKRVRGRVVDSGGGYTE